MAVKHNDDSDLTDNEKTPSQQGRHQGDLNTDIGTQAAKERVSDPDATEGQLAPRYNALVRKETCAAIARDIGDRSHTLRVLSNLAIVYGSSAFDQSTGHMQRVQNLTVYAVDGAHRADLCEASLDMDFTGVTHRTTWGAVLPEDSTRMAQEEQGLVQAGIHSLSGISSRSKNSLIRGVVPSPTPTVSGSRCPTSGERTARWSCLSATTARTSRRSSRG